MERVQVVDLGNVSEPIAAAVVYSQQRSELGRTIVLETFYQDGLRWNGRVDGEESRQLFLRCLVNEWARLLYGAAVINGAIAQKEQQPARPVRRRIHEPRRRR